jgi:hypothetical protein
MRKIGDSGKFDGLPKRLSYILARSANVSFPNQENIPVSGIARAMIADRGEAIGVGTCGEAGEEAIGIGG